MKLPDWKVYYGDGTTYSSFEGKPEDAPGGNVQVIAYYDEDNRRRLAFGKRHYTYKAPCWIGLDKIDYTQYVLRPGFKILKLGETILDSQHQALMLRASTELPLERAA